MSKRKRNILFSLTALIVGCLLYILFRKNTYIGGVFAGMENIDTIRQMCHLHVSDLYKFYLPDFLWGFALGCGLIAIYNPRIKGVIICASFSFLCGCVWELLQCLEVLSGTGDVYDVIMYLLASAICIIINLKETREE